MAIPTHQVRNRTPVRRDEDAMTLGENAADWWKSTEDGGPEVDRDANDALIAPLGDGEND